MKCFICLLTLLQNFTDRVPRTGSALTELSQIPALQSTRFLFFRGNLRVIKDALLLLGKKTILYMNYYGTSH